MLHMEQSPSRFNPLNVAKVFCLLWLFSIFFPIRYVFLNKLSLATGQYSDFTSISLYLSDILLLTTWIFILPRGKDFYHVVKRQKYLLFWLVLGFIANFGLIWYQNLYFLVKFVKLIVAYGTVAMLFSKTSIKTAFLSLFAALASLQSLIALNQFFFQHPVGMFKFGEQQIYPWATGVAKLIVNGVTYIRGYGTFPHPNVLSAFLVAGIFICLYLFSFTKRLWAQAIVGACLILNILGLTVTFSRAAYLSLALGLIAYFGYLIFKKLWNREHSASVMILLIGIIFSVILFHKFLLTRATVTDEAAMERGLYSKIAVRMIAAKPLFGVGLGESVLHMQQFSPVKLWPWEIQPIHNYFLISAAELGILGALILIWIFLSHLYTIRSTLSATLSPWPLALSAILATFLLLMFFDHYFYTLQQTQFLLWIVLGMIAAETNKYLNKNEQTKTT